MLPTVHWQVEVVRVVNPDSICGSIGERRASKVKSCWYLCKKQNLKIPFPIVAFKFHKKTAHKGEGKKKTFKEWNSYSRRHRITQEDSRINRLQEVGGEIWVAQTRL